MNEFKHACSHKRHVKLLTTVVVVGSMIASMLDPKFGFQSAVLANLIWIWVE